MLLFSYNRIQDRMNIQETENIQSSTLLYLKEEDLKHDIDLILTSEDTSPTNSNEHRSVNEKSSNSQESCYDLLQCQPIVNHFQILSSTQPQDVSPTEDQTEVNSKKGSQSQIPAIILQQQQDDDLLIDTILNNAEQSKQILASAFDERKQANRLNFSSYIQRKDQYYSQFIQNLTKIEGKVSENIHDTDLVGKQMIKFLKETRQVYHNFSRDLKKISFRIPDSIKTQLWGTVIPNIFQSINQYREESLSASKAFTQLLETETIPRLEAVLKQSKQKIQTKYKESKRMRESFVKKEMCIPDNIQDTLLQQLKINKEIEQERKKLKKWGVTISQAVQLVAEKNSKFIKTFKQQILIVVSNLKMVNGKSRHLFEAEASLIKLQADQNFQREKLILESKLQLEVFNRTENAQSKKFNAFDYLKLNNIQDKFGNINQILRQLYINVYKVMADFTHKEPKATQAFFSIDNNLIVVDQFGKIRNSFKIDQILYAIDRFELVIDENKPKVFGIQNKKKLKLIFNSDNQAEEFVALLEFMKNLDLKRQ